MNSTPGKDCRYTGKMCMEQSGNKCDDCPVWKAKEIEILMRHAS